MKYFTAILIYSISFASYYAIGDTISYEHQSEAFDVCYGEYPSDQLQLADFNGKISIFGLSASW
jgi:hypothetical protein